MRVAWIACLGFSMVAVGQDKPLATIERIELRDCGIYESRDDSREKDAAAKSGYHRIVKDNKLVKATDRIPAVMGTRFGCGVMLRGSPSGMDASYRAIMRVDGADGTRKEMAGSQTYSIDAEGGYAGMTLRREDLLIPGQWSMATWVGDRKMAEWKFTVVKP